jgi:hypothetical protein
MLQQPKGPNGTFTDEQIRRGKAYVLENSGASFGMPAKSQNLLEKLRKTFRRNIVKTPQTVEEENLLN